MVAIDASSVATCDSSAIVTLSRNRRCTRVLTVCRNQVAVGGDAEGKHGEPHERPVAREHTLAEQLEPEREQRIRQRREQRQRERGKKQGPAHGGSPACTAATWTREPAAGHRHGCVASQARTSYCFPSSSSVREALRLQVEHRPIAAVHAPSARRACRARRLCPSRARRSDRRGARSRSGAR